ncbi:MAG: TPM domain-containing protein [Propionibacteriaceae bacterium]|jgi:uncharacterized protein|nr:TPM domain-containing protein [Propionibacteriaceae bacterium]
MLRRAIAALLLAALAATATPAWADDLARVGEGERLPRFVDDVGLLDESQAATLTARLDEVSDAHVFDTVVVVVEEIDDREPRLYAADFYEENNYGMDAQSPGSGAILLIAMQTRQFGFATTGVGMSAFTDAGQEYLDTFFVPYLREDDWYGAFMGFANAVDDFLNMYQAGTPYTTSNIPGYTSAQQDYDYPESSGEIPGSGIRANRETVTVLSICAVIFSLLIGFGFPLYWRSKLKSVKPAAGADDYTRPGSFQVTNQYDNFLYTTMRVTPIPKSDSGGGGSHHSSSSSSFSSSSGSSFSGHSGSF